MSLQLCTVLLSKKEIDVIQGLIDTTKKVSKISPTQRKYLNRIEQELDSIEEDFITCQATDTRESKMKKCLIKASRIL